MSGNNRKAKFYAITEAGKRKLAEDAAYWERLTGVMDRVLGMELGVDAEPGKEPA